jgi:hypothetical protein
MLRKSWIRRTQVSLCASRQYRHLMEAHLVSLSFALRRYRVQRDQIRGPTCRLLAWTRLLHWFFLCFGSGFCRVGAQSLHFLSPRKDRPHPMLAVYVSPFGAKALGVGKTANRRGYASVSRLWLLVSFALSRARRRLL